MKILKAFLLILIHVVCAQAQEFAPVGATWHYTERFAFSSNIGFLKIESVGDTLINGKNCRILQANHPIAQVFWSDPYYVAWEDSAAWFYEPYFDDFRILFDLKAEKDSSWMVIFRVNDWESIDSLKVTVDSTGMETLNGFDLKKLYVTYQAMNSGYPNIAYNGEILEKIGDIDYLFNLYGMVGVAVDANYSGGLRCYEDPDFGFYSTGIADSCTYVGVPELKPDDPVRVYPNPVSEQLFIDFDDTDAGPFSLEIFSTTGRLIYRVDKLPRNGTILNRNMLTQGIIILKLTGREQVYQSRIVVL